MNQYRFYYLSPKEMNYIDYLVASKQLQVEHAPNKELCTDPKQFEAALYAKICSDKYK